MCHIVDLQRCFSLIDNRYSLWLLRKTEGENAIAENIKQERGEDVYGRFIPAFAGNIQP